VSFEDAGAFVVRGWEPRGLEYERLEVAPELRLQLFAYAVRNICPGICKTSNNISKVNNVRSSLSTVWTAGRFAACYWFTQVRVNVDERTAAHQEKRKIFSPSTSNECDVCKCSKKLIIHNSRFILLGLDISEPTELGRPEGVKRTLSSTNRKISFNLPARKV
jgi:hypothetical protein